MPPSLADTFAILERTPPVLDALLAGLPEPLLHARQSPDSWSPLEIAGHLAHLENTDWILRARRILQSRDAIPFDPIDRLGHLREFSASPLAQVLDAFRHRRAANLAELRALDLLPGHLETPGFHPALGHVTLGQLLASWAAHDLTHLHQLSRVLAHPLASAVGPWKAYLGVLHCDAHGA